MPAVPHQLHPLVSPRAFSAKRRSWIQEPLWGSFYKRGTILLAEPETYFFISFFF